MQVAPRATLHPDPIKKSSTLADRWYLQNISLCRLCNASGLKYLINIYRTLDPLQKDKAVASLEISYNKARYIRYKASRISHAVAGLMISLALYTEDPVGVGDTVNFFYSQTSISQTSPKQH